MKKLFMSLDNFEGSREHLATLLWGNRFDEQARNSLRQALYALRKALGPDAILGSDDLRLAEDSLQFDSNLDGVVTLLNCRHGNSATRLIHAAAVTVCHVIIASLRNWRSVLREIRWRWTLKVL